MTSDEAIITIINDARSKCGSKSSLARLRRALTVLELSADERERVLVALDYCDTDGTLYPQYAA